MANVQSTKLLKTKTAEFVIYSFHKIISKNPKMTILFLLKNPKCFAKTIPPNFFHFLFDTSRSVSGLQLHTYIKQKIENTTKFVFFHL